MNRDGRPSTGTTIITTLVEVQGGPDCWERATAEFATRGWAARDSTPRERRIARRSFEAQRDSRFCRVEVPVPGSSWRADKRVGWLVADAARDAKVALQDRLYVATEADRAMQPAWRAYSTRHLASTIRPADAPNWSRPLWWARRALYRTAVRLGLYDLRAGRVRAPHKEGAQRAARELLPQAPRSDVDIRPLDGLGRPGTPLYGEGEFNRALMLFGGLLITAGLLVCLARDAPPAGKVLFGTLAAGCAAAGWWHALALPLGRTRANTVPVALIFTLVILVVIPGVPGVHEGVSRRDALVYGLCGYYIGGLVLLVHRWRWQGLFVGVLPVLTTLVVAVLPVTRTLLHDMYADHLALTPAETKVSTVWELVATVQLLWPSFIAILGVAAGWGVLRYFHFVRGNAFPELIVFALIAMLAELTAFSVTLSSPKRAASAMTRAAHERTGPPPYFGVTPSWICATPTESTSKLNEQGGVLDKRHPYLSFGVADSHVVLWNTDVEAPLRIPADQVRLTPANRTAREEGRCPQELATSR